MKKLIYLFLTMAVFTACDLDDFIGDPDPDPDPDPPVLENVVYDEAVDGDISDDNAAPTALDLSEGYNRVIADQTGDPRDIDYLAVTVPEGYRLSRLLLEEFNAEPENLAFLGFVAGDTFPINVLADGNPAPSDLLGGVVYGANDVDTNLLISAAALDGVQGFEGPLPAGTYTFWFNQTGPTSGGTFNFDVERAVAVDPPAVENVVYDEAVDGDISDDNAAPTAIDLGEGDNRVIADQTGDPRDIDYLTVTVPEGYQLSQLLLDEFRAEPENLAFLGFVSGDSFPINVLADGNPAPSDLLGGAVYGVNDVDTDLLISSAALDGVQGFDGALPAGTYTFWFNQTGPTSGGTFNFVVEMAEDPGDANAGPIIYTGPTLEFTKAPNADFTLAENQDMITENVILTRGNTMGLFNIAQEDAFASGQRDSPSPVGTEWAVGSTADDLSSLTFMTWGRAVGNPTQAVSNGTNYVLHLIEEDIFIDVVFTEWSQGGNGGGGFTYERSTPAE